MGENTDIIYIVIDAGTGYTIIELKYYDPEHHKKMTTGTHSECAQWIRQNPHKKQTHLRKL